MKHGLKKCNFPVSGQSVVYDDLLPLPELPEVEAEHPTVVLFVKVLVIWHHRVQMVGVKGQTGDRGQQPTVTFQHILTIQQISSWQFKY